MINRSLEGNVTNSNWLNKLKTICLRSSCCCCCCCCCFRQSELYSSWSLQILMLKCCLKTKKRGRGWTKLKKRSLISFNKWGNFFLIKLFIFGLRLKWPRAAWSRQGRRHLCKNARNERERIGGSVTKLGNFLRFLCHKFCFKISSNFCGLFWAFCK